MLGCAFDSVHARTCWRLIFTQQHLQRWRQANTPSRHPPFKACCRQRRPAVACAGQLQPVHGQHLHADDGQVVLQTCRRWRGGCVRQRCTGRSGCQVVACSGRLAHALPDLIDFWPTGANQHMHPHAKLPAQALTPEHHAGMRRGHQLCDLGTATVGIKNDACRTGLRLPEHHSTGFGQAVRANSGQHRCTPLMVPVIDSALQLCPDTLADFLFGLKGCFHRRGAAACSERKKGDGIGAGLTLPA